MTQPEEAPRRPAALAAFLSFVLPGLGQAFVGAWRRALLLVAPFVAILIVLALVAGEGGARFVGLILQPRVLLVVFAVNLAIFALRLFATGDAFRLAMRLPGARNTASRSQLAILAALVIVLGLSHGWVAAVTYMAYDTINTVVVTATPTPQPSTAPGSPGATADPTFPGPGWAADGRLDLMLIGSDAGPRRISMRTDSMILLSVDIATGRAAMFGFPRNLRNAPLPPYSANAFACRCYPDLLNSIFVYANEHPEWFHGEDDLRGYYAVQETLQELVGRPIDGMVILDLNGFVRLVDAFGGLEIYVPVAISDSHYRAEDGITGVPMYLPAGQQHLDGHMALFYARTRHQDNDYNRMQRQQDVLQALRRQLDPCSLVFRLPELLDIVHDSLWTNVPIDTLPELLAVGSRVEADAIVGHMFWPPDIPENLDASAIESIRRIVADAFVSSTPGSPGPSPTPTATPGSFGC